MGLVTGGREPVVMEAMGVIKGTGIAGCVLLLAACAAVDTSGPGTLPIAATTSNPTSTTSPTATAAPDAAAPGTARLLFAGDVMPGRRVAPVIAAEGVDLFRDVRATIRAADVAAFNLESPLTVQPHVAENPNELEADPAAAEVLAAAGFDLAVLANNHAGDAGGNGVVDTLAALDAAGVAPLGAGADAGAAHTAHLVEVRGLRIAFLAFDATGLGLAAGPAMPGVAAYEPEAARAAVGAAAGEADVVAVSLHGGLEYVLAADPILEDIADDLVTWGADVVWGHGGHVPQPVTLADGPDGRRAVVATGLGNFLFDQQRTLTQTGLLLEVLVAADGVVAYRVGQTEHGDLRPRFVAWDLPEGDAVHFEGSWWSLVATPPAIPQDPIRLEEFTMGDVTTAAVGDATGDGIDDLVVSYRHPFRSNQVNELYPEHDFIDAQGRSAHLGVFEPGTLRPIWAAGTVLKPISQIAVCDGAVALAFDRLDDPAVVAAGAWTWWDFGFAVADELPGPGVPACLDVDGDGVREAAVIRGGEDEA